MNQTMYVLKITLIIVGVLIIGIIIYLIDAEDDNKESKQSEVEYINSLNQLPSAKKFILFIEKNHISEIQSISEKGYSVIIEYKLEKAFRRKQPQYKLIKFDVIIYKNNKQIIEHNATHYQDLIIDEIVSDIDNLVQSAISKIYQECIEYKSSIFSA